MAPPYPPEVEETRARAVEKIIMKKGVVAKRYAKALVEMGREDNKFREIGEELRNIAAIFSSNPELKRFLLNVMYALKDRLVLTEKISEALKISDIVKRFLALLVERRCIGIIEDISIAYSKMEDELAGRIKIKVESAIELSEGRIKEINKRLQDLTKKEVTLTVEKNPSLIGGLVFTIGNIILDGSIKTQLEKVRERIIAGSMQ